MHTRRIIAAVVAPLACLAVSTAILSAQAIPRSAIEDQVLGWIRIYDYKGATQPITADGRVFSVKQLSIAQLFANWMQASLVPTGALGDVVQIRNERISPYNRNTAARPQSYGAYAKLYTELKYGANRKPEPLTNSHAAWTIEANGFYGTPANAISSPERYYFTLPTFAQQGYGEELDTATSVASHPVLGRFPSYYARNSVNGNRRVVFLTKDRRLPFVTVTKGQFLDALEAAILRFRVTEKARITEAEQGIQRRIDVAMQDVEARTTKRLTVLASNREKYRNRLQETAEVFTDQPDIMLENYPDAFEGTGGTPLRLPLYTIDPRVFELAKTDTPQWILMSWTAQLNDPVSLSLHKTILETVNVQFIYDYFFDPDKVKGQSYAPLKSPSAVAPVVTSELSAAAKKNAADPAVHFFDDFSSTPAGSKALNWRSTLDRQGASSTVTTLAGLDGHWASMGGFLLTPTQMKMPLPADFELSYDVVAARSYRWGARGLEMKLSRTPASPTARESYLSVRIRPGFDGRQGETRIEAEFPGVQGYMGGVKFAAAPGFSNDKPANRTTVTIRKKGDLLQVLVGGTQVIEYDKGVPPGVTFNAMSFDLSGTASDETEKMFIGNIRIAKN